MVTLDVNLKRGAYSQYSGFAFNSMVKFNGKYLGANSAGLFAIEGKTDNGADIDAEMELPTTDFGLRQHKRVRFVDVGYETDGSVLFNFVFDQDELAGEDYEVEAHKTGQQRGRFSVKHTQRGRYVTVTVKNVNGADFSLDHISILPVILHPGRR